MDRISRDGPPMQRHGYSDRREPGLSGGDGGGGGESRGPLPQSRGPPPPGVFKFPKSRIGEREVQRGGRSGRGGRGNAFASRSKAHHKLPPKDEIIYDPNAPNNDYCQHFVDTGQRPQNFVRDHDIENRFTDFPKLKELITLKTELIKKWAQPPMHVKCDLKTFDLGSLGSKFDVILIDPPWEEYVRRCPGARQNTNRAVWSWQDMMKLRIDQVASSPSYIFLWCGSAEGLEHGRRLFKKWNYRRCEDIVWIKCNREKGHREGSTNKFVEEGTIVQRTAEHCLMGIKGTVHRATDGHFIHANVDTDILISEMPDYGETRKPEEMYDLIERFCMGRRRLELFGTENNIRPGWVTLGDELPSSNYGQLVAAQNCVLALVLFFFIRALRCEQTRMRTWRLSRTHRSQATAPRRATSSVFTTTSCWKRSTHCGPSIPRASKRPRAKAKEAARAAEAVGGVVFRECLYLYYWRCFA